MIQDVLIILVGLLSTVYLYYCYIYNHWVRKGIPQASPVFLVGNFLDVVLNRKNAGWIYNELYSKFQNNDAVGFYEFQTPKLLVKTPELIEKILIKDFASFYDNEIYVSLKLEPFMRLNSFLMRGEKWKPARNALINGLTNSKLKAMYELMKHTVPHLYNYVDEHLDKDMEALELAHLFGMTNVSNTVYGIDSNCFTDTNAIFRKMAQLFSQEYWQSWWPVLIVFYLQRLRDFLGFRFIPQKVSKFVEDMVRQVADARLQNNTERKDFFNYYLNQNKPLEDKTNEIISHGMTFFVAGFETTSLTSASLIYELALNTTIQEILYDEIQEAFNGKPELDYDTLMTLPYLDKTVKETLRKYPIMYGIMRVCTKTTTLEIDGKHIKIDSGTSVVVPTYAIQHDPKYYPDPEVFDPERFSEEAVRSRPPCTWLPFGAGPRTCAGMKFGLLQAKLFLASLVYKYKIVRTDRTPPNVSMKKSSFLIVPEDAQWIRLVKRA